MSRILPATPLHAASADEGTPVSVKIRERIRAAGQRFNANDNIAEFIQPGELERLLDEVEGRMQAVLDSLVIDTERDHNTDKTARRVAKMYLNEVFHGRYTPAPTITVSGSEGSTSVRMPLILRAPAPAPTRTSLGHFRLTSAPGSCAAIALRSAAPATSGIHPRSAIATAPTRSSTETASAVPGGADHTRSSRPRRRSAPTPAKSSRKPGSPRPKSRRWPRAAGLRNQLP